uniref:Uncharacterized protein n=1 Tax=Tanacetum cinerariifolium TaxID=118510 RepID=A0A6L2MFS6_TANCI|nr:hypothetical protein [Tanacetum cinerariifolium]
MPRANPRAVIVSEVQLVPSANRLKMTKNNQFDSDMHSKGQDLPLTKLTNTVKGDQKANVPSAFKKNVVPRKTSSLTVANHIVEEPVAVKLVKSISIKEQRHQQRVIITQLTIDRKIKKDVEDKYTGWGQKLKGPQVEDPVVQSLLDLRKGSKARRLESIKQMKQVVAGEGSCAAHNKYYEFENILATDSDTTQDSYRLDINEERDDETDDSDDFNLDLSKDEPKGDDDVTGFRVFVYNKFTEPLKSIYLSPTVTTSSLEYIQSLLNETYVNELMAFINPSFYKRSHDHRYPPTDREKEKRKKGRKDDGQSSTQSSRKDKAPTVQAQEDTLADQPQDQKDVYVLNRPNKLKELIQKYELTMTDLEGVGLEKLKQQYKNDVELEYLVDQPKAAVLSKAQWNSDEGDVSKPSTKEKYTTSLTKRYAARYHIQVIEDIVLDIWSKEVHRYQIEALNGIHHWEQDMYLLNVQDKMHHLPSDDEIDLNNALILIIQRTIIKNRVEDLQLGVENYQRTLNLTKPKLYFDGIDEKIPYTMTRTEKGVVYLNKHNHQSLMKLNEAYKFRDGTLMKIQENLIDMVNKSKMGRGNARLRGGD